MHEGRVVSKVGGCECGVRFSCLDVIVAVETFIQRAMDGLREYIGLMSCSDVRVLGEVLVESWVLRTSKTCNKPMSSSIFMFSMMHEESEDVSSGILAWSGEDW